MWQYAARRTDRARNGVREEERPGVANEARPRPGRRWRRHGNRPWRLQDLAPVVAREVPAGGVEVARAVERRREEVDVGSAGRRARRMRPELERHRGCGRNRRKRREE